jgi:hypothetical protein
MRGGQRWSVWGVVGCGECLADDGVQPGGYLACGSPLTGGLLGSMFTQRCKAPLAGGLGPTSVSRHLFQSADVRRREKELLG